MPRKVPYQCLSCGKRFEAEVLTKEEAKEIDRKGRPRYPIQCPDCRQTDVREGWS